MHTGKALTADEMKELALDEDDDENDSDYEFNGGDMSLYDSRIDDIDELQFLKNTVSGIHNADQATYNRLMSGVTDPEQMKKF